MSIQNKPCLAACLLLLPFQVALADLPADRLVTEPDTGFDITPAAAPQVEAAPTPANTQPDKRLQMSREELLKRPELLQQALSYAVLTHNADGAALLLPIYLELPGPHDALLVVLAQALIARAEGDYQRAIGLYRAVLAADPDIPPVRLSLAQSLFENRADKDARQEFEYFRQTPNLAPELQQLAGQYLEALRKRDPQTYAARGCAFSINAARYLLDHAPHLKAVGFDFISLASPANAAHGVKAHQILLGMYSDAYICIIEDIALAHIDASRLRRVIAMPLRVRGVDSGQVSILAELDD